MAIKDWITAFTGANPEQDPDPITTNQPDLDDETSEGAGDGDAARSSHPEMLRDKLHALARLVGDYLNLLVVPATGAPTLAVVTSLGALKSSIDAIKGSI